MSVVKNYRKGGFGHVPMLKVIDVKHAKSFDICQNETEEVAPPV